jgi:hypothetical protein
MRLCEIMTVSAAVLALCAATPSRAQVSTCDGFLLYGNGTAAGNCLSLSKITQTHWVCGLQMPAVGVPDIHLTFNDTTNLHFTVVTPTCNQSSQLTGTFPGGFAFGPSQPTTLCTVNLAPWLTQINQVVQVARTAKAPSPLTRAAFLEAVDQAPGVIDQSKAQGYIDKASDVRHHCP